MMHRIRRMESGRLRQLAHRPMKQSYLLKDTQRVFGYRLEQMTKDMQMVFIVKQGGTPVFDAETSNVWQTWVTGSEDV